RGTGENRAAEAARAATTSPLLDTSIEGARAVLFNIAHGGKLGLREMDIAARVIAESVDPDVNLIFGELIDPGLQDEVVMTVIGPGFPPKMQILDDPRETTRRTIADIGLAGISSSEDADLPAFIRRNPRSLNALRADDLAAAKLAERR